MDIENIMEAEKEEDCRKGDDDNLKEDGDSTTSESDSDEDNKNSEYRSEKKCDIDKLRALSAQDSYSHLTKKVSTSPKLNRNVNRELA